MTYNLSDESISQIAKLLQLAIITGTDIVDNLRLMRLEAREDGTLVPESTYLENFEKNLNKLIAQAAAEQVDQVGEENEWISST
jgi:hypothetical protein